MKYVSFEWEMIYLLNIKILIKQKVEKLANKSMINTLNYTMYHQHVENMEASGGRLLGD